MKTVLILAGLVALTMGGAVPEHHDWKMKTVDADFVARQKRVLSLFEHVDENDHTAECHKAGMDYSIEANIEHYTNKKAVEEFLTLWKTGFLPKYHEFSIFYERMRDEVISLFHVMYYAKDFETFYKTASWAKVYLNEGQFLYAYYIAVLQRPDCQGIVLPAPYELYPQYFFNMDVFYKQYAKYFHNIDKWATEYGIVEENDKFVFYTNYSSSLTYPNEEQRLSYFTEDIGLNAYYYYFHTHLPFWWNSDKFGEFKERRGEIYFYFYQQLLARYYMERLTNGLGEIPEFSWYLPFKTGYYPQLSTFVPFAQRSNYYDVHSEKNFEPIRFLDAYEKTFFQYLQQGHFKAFDKEIDFHNPKAINFVGNYWQTNADLYSEEHIEDYQHSYEITARHVLGGSPKPYDKYTFMPSALDFYQTSLRDPAFYQLYQRIVDYLIHYKEYLHPYTHDDLHFVGVKVSDVKVDKLVTYFDYFDFTATNTMKYTKNELKKYPHDFVFRQPRLNHVPFNVDINVKSDVASDAVFKIFIGPKYDSNGYPLNMEHDWNKFYELDWFIHKLTPGENKIVRKSSEFMFFKEDSMPTHEIYKWLDQGKVPYDMSVVPDNLPRRLMLPKGTHGGYPFQFFVFVYPYNGVSTEKDVFKNYILDNKPFGYPFDRPVQESSFKQPNMFFEDVEIFHKGEVYPYQLNTPAYFTQDGCGEMKTVLFLAGLVALALGGAVPQQQWKWKTVDADFVARQKRVLSLFEHVDENDHTAECHKAGMDYSIEANIEHYTNRKAVEEFLTLWKTGFLPKYHEFSIFYERMRDEAISLFHVMYYAKDFETFYKTASWAKVYLNEGQFFYAYYIAVVQRPDCQGIVLPAPYELFPQYFFNVNTFNKLYEKFLGNMEKWDGMVVEKDDYVFYTNYSSSLTYPNEEQRLSYFTEDIGLNAYYYYFHTHLPFWWNSDKFGEFKERRGEIYFYFYQQLLARYYMERLTNGLGEIPEFSWFLPFKTGYYPHLSANFVPFAQRSNYYDVHSEKNFEPIRFLDAYEKTFFQYLQQGHFKAFDKEIDFHNPKAINFVGNYWQTNADLYSEEHIEDYQHSYEITARHVLGGSPKPYDKYTFMPSALDFYQTSLRDPAFYQLYQRIVDYLIHFKEYLHPYTHDDLHFVGVKINDVKVDKLVTYFDYFDFKMTNSILLSKKQLQDMKNNYVMRQPRLTHEPFNVNINVKSDVASNAVFKIFIGPKYDSNGYPLNMEQDWMKFYELDWFVQKLTPGENKVVRKSSEFMFFKEDSAPTHEIYKWLDQGKVPYDMSVVPDNMPRRLMLPKGTHGGYPFQFFVFVYPFNGVSTEKDVFKNYVMDNKPFGYPFDRPVQESCFKQPNMFFEDVEIFHKGEVYPYQLNTPAYFNQKKH
ncbi:uncharacterized protein LOC142979612 [Anticarsia gemmatalis]|uniref:uncharacterized protein LOC142979612 n=1 Tax=Anticarsia gemmatalis TaxID=129554 RepID=UPI003F76E7AE